MGVVRDDQLGISADVSWCGSRGCRGVVVAVTERSPALGAPRGHNAPANDVTGGTQPRQTDATPFLISAFGLRRMRRNEEMFIGAVE